MKGKYFIVIARGREDIEFQPETILLTIEFSQRGAGYLTHDTQKTVFQAQTIESHLNITTIEGLN